MTKKDLTRIAVVCLVSTVIVASALTFMDPSHWVIYVYDSFVFSFCIGISISILIHIFLHRLKLLSLIPRTGALFVLFLIGGLVGTEIGTIILKMNLDMQDHFRLLLFNLLLATIFGGIAFLYLTLRGKVQRMAEKLKEKEIQEEKLMRLKTEAELEALQAKVNPHFLFNTLNSIASLISENPAAAEETVEKLSGLFRYTLQSTVNSTVKLSEELEIVRLYLQIEKIRFGNRLEFEIISDDRLNNIDVPALLIQPLVENSIKHGIALEVQGGTIRVEAKQIDEECHIIVTDSGKGFTAEAGETGFGLKSIRERLKLLYGNKATLNVFHDGNTHLHISIPIY
ncbi:MAG: histidine kinase [Bacteroidota bacterium]